MVQNSVLLMSRRPVKRMNSQPTRIDLEITNLRHQPQKLKFFDLAPVRLRANVAKPILPLSVAFALSLSAALLRLVRNVKIMTLTELCGHGFFSLRGLIHILRPTQRRTTEGQLAFVQLCHLALLASCRDK